MGLQKRTYTDQVTVITADNLNDIQDAIIALENAPAQGLTEDVKQALLQLAQKVAYIDSGGATYYQDLYDAMYPPKELVSISAVFTQGQTVVYDTDSLDSLKSMLVVTGTYDDQSTETIPSTGYTLSGTLTPGTSTITVACDGKTTTFTVQVTHQPGVYAVTNNLTGCVNSNSASSVTEGGSYSGAISASAGYMMTGATVSITMGGVDITSTAYSNGTISIASVTGALVISVTAVAVTLSSISAVYTQSGTVLETDSLDSLKTDLVVTATYSDSSTETVPASDYTLSGTLTAGTSTITVSYGGKTTTFTVTVTAGTEILTTSTYKTSATGGTWVNSTPPFRVTTSGTANWNITITPNTTGLPSPKISDMIGHKCRLVVTSDWASYVEGSVLYVAIMGTTSNDGSQTRGAYKLYSVKQDSPNLDIEFVVSQAYFTSDANKYNANHYFTWRAYAYSNAGADVSFNVHLYDLGLEA